MIESLKIKTLSLLLIILLFHMLNKYIYTTNFIELNKLLHIKVQLRRFVTLQRPWSKS